MDGFKCNNKNIWCLFDLDEDQIGYRTCKMCKSSCKYENKDTKFLSDHMIEKHQNFQSPRKRSFEIPNVSSAAVMDVIICKFVAIQKLPIMYLTVNAPCRDEYVRLMPNIPTGGPAIRTLIIEKFRSIKKCLKVSLKSLLDKNHRFSMITQEHCNLINRKYISVKLNGNNECGEPFQYCLGLKRVKNSISSEIYAETIIKMLEEYDIDLKNHIVAITTDNSPKMIKVGQLLEPVIHQVCASNSINVVVNKMLFQRVCDNRKPDHVDDTCDGEEVSENSHDMRDAAHEENNFFDSYITKEEINDIVSKLYRTSKTLKETEGVFGDVLKFIDANRRTKDCKNWNEVYELFHEFDLSKEKIRDIFCQNCKQVEFNELDVQKISGLVRCLSLVKSSVERMSQLSSSCLSIKLLMNTLSKIRFMENEILGEDLNKNIIKSLEACYSHSNFIKMLEWLRNPRMCEPCANIISSIVFHIVRLFPCLINSICNVHSPDKCSDPCNSFSKTPNTSCEIQCEDYDDVVSDVPRCSDIRPSEKSLFDEIKEAKLYNRRGPILNLLLNALLTVRPLSCEKDQIFDLTEHSIVLFKCQMTDRLVNALLFLNYNAKLYVDTTRFVQLS